MIRAGSKLWLLSLTVACAVLEKSDGFSHSRIGQIYASTAVTKLESFERVDPTDVTPTEPAAFLDYTIDNWEIFQDIKKQINLDLQILQEEAKSCRKNYPHLSDQMFNFRLYAHLLQKLAGSPKENSIFHCNIDRELIVDLKKRLQQLDFFQKSFLMNKKNDSFPSSPHVNCPGRAEDNFLNNAEESFENDLRLNLEDEWKAKVPHVSHIYLGRSIFPMITEESRVLDKHQTTRSSGVTKRPTTRDTSGQKSESRTIAKVYQLLTPYRWNKNAQTQDDDTHGYRSPEETATDFHQVTQRFHNPSEVLNEGKNESGNE